MSEKDKIKREVSKSIKTSLNSSEELEEAIEEIVEEKIESKTSNKSKKEELENLDRRKFLKRLGGATGLGALALVPGASALENSESLQVYCEGGELETEDRLEASTVLTDEIGSSGDKVKTAWISSIGSRSTPAESVHAENIYTSDSSGNWREVSPGSQKVETQTVTKPASPVERYGKLSVSGTKLVDERGKPVQLRGMSSHGLQWFGLGDCLTDSSLDALAFDWESDLLRVSMYVQEEGYETDPAGFTSEVNRIVEKASDRGMYVIIDFHVLDPGDPMVNLENAKRFFSEVSREHSEKQNVIYEICNEPNGVSWQRIKSYAEEVIPVIRQNDDAPIIVGTRGWSSMGLAEGSGPQEVIDNPLQEENILYSYHFYAGQHGEWERRKLEKAAKNLPVFVSEWGSMQASGDGENDFKSSQEFLKIMDRYDISWAFWSFSDDKRTSGIWQEGTTSRTEAWAPNNLNQTGWWIRNQIKNSGRI